MTENRTLADCALASARLFEAQQWKWARHYDYHELDVPDAERILEMLQHLYESAMAGSEDSYGGWCRSGSGRLRVEVDREDGSVTVWQQLGEIGLGTSRD